MRYNIRPRKRNLIGIFVVVLGGLGLNEGKDKKYLGRGKKSFIHLAQEREIGMQF
jgi:hypothetical protein